AFTRSTLEFPTTSFMLMTMQNSRQEACLRQERTPKLRLLSRTHCTCHHISLRDLVYGKIPSLVTSRREERRAGKATRAKSCTLWIIWCTPIYKVAATERRLRSSSKSK